MDISDIKATTDTTDDDYGDLQGLYDVLEAANKQLENDVSFYKQDRDELSMQNLKLAEKTNDALMARQTLQDDIEKLEQEKNDLQAQKDKLSRRVEKFRKKIDEWKNYGRNEAKMKSEYKDENDKLKQDKTLNDEFVDSLIEQRDDYMKVLSNMVIYQKNWNNILIVFTMVLQ